MVDPQSRPSFMKSLFHGVIAEEELLPFPEPNPRARERVTRARSAIDELFDGHDAAQVDRDRAVDPELLARLAKEGFFGLQIPEEFGGLGFSHAATARLMTELSKRDASVAWILASHNTLGTLGLSSFGKRAQKKRWLPKLASGEVLASFAFTEPDAGSDAAGLRTRAAFASERFVLNGRKSWVTNGDRAELFTVFARTSDGPKPKVTAFLIPRGKGITSGAPIGTIGIKAAPTTTLELVDVHAERSQVLGDEGRGFRVAVETLSNSRLALAAWCLGGSRALLERALRRANERRAFGRPIGEFGMIKEKLAEMSCAVFALESTIAFTAGRMDRDADCTLESAICKVLASETHWMVAHETLQIAASAGLMSDLPYERHLRDARMGLALMGTNETLRAFIALAGMQGPGRHLQQVGKAMREPIKGFGVLTDFAIARARAMLGRERLSRVHPALAREAVIFDECVALFARESERVLRKHGVEIAEMQFVQRRMADVAIDLLALAATLSRTTLTIERRGEEGARRQIELTSGFTVLARRRLHARLDDMEREEDELFKHISERARRDGVEPDDMAL